MLKTKYLLLAILLITSFFTFAQTGIIKGRVVNSLNNEPVMFANILVVGTDRGETTDENGDYFIEGLEPGLYSISVSFVGFKDETAYEIQVSNSKPAIINLKMEEYAEELEEVVVKASPFRKTEESPVSLRSIGIAEIQRNPGGNRDISRVVQNLPGVTTTASFRNDLIIRGGAPNENRFYLDDVEVPNINHFATQGASGGPVGLINVDFIREVDFYSGAFPANRGNALSSVFNFKQRDGRNDRLGFTGTVGASDLGMTLEGPIGKKTTFLFSARRSYLQFLFEALGLPFLPTYNDFQTKFKVKLDTKNELTFIGLGAIDNFELNLDANETEEQQYLLDNLPVNTQWNYTNGIVYKRYRDSGYTTFVLSRNMLNNKAEKYLNNDDTNEDNLILNYQSQEIENKLRIENTSRRGAYKLNVGVNYEFVKYNNTTKNKIFTSSGPQDINYSSNFNMHKYGLFGQVSRTWMNDRLILSLGLRTDANSYSNEMSNPLQQLSPRFSLSYALNERLSFNFNTGIYYQLPPYTILGYQEDGAFVNKENGAKYVRNNHFVAGLEFNTATSSKITIEGYYKYYNDYPFLLRDSLTLANLGGDFGVIGNEPSVPRADGKSYGIEFLFQQRLYKGFYGIASYTLGWSEFEDKKNNFVASSWDARNIVNLTLGKRFKKNWEVGVNWRFQSGLPYSPFDLEQSALVDNWQRNGRATRNYNLLNTERGEASSVLNMRVDKKWFFKKWSLNLYLDIQNVLGNSVAQEEYILDRSVELDDNGSPLGGVLIENPAADPSDWRIIENPTAAPSDQRYQLKTLDAATSSPIPTLGIVIGI